MSSSLTKALTSCNIKLSLECWWFNDTNYYSHKNYELKYVYFTVVAINSSFHCPRNISQRPFCCWFLCHSVSQKNYLVDCDPCKLSNVNVYYSLNLYWLPILCPGTVLVTMADAEMNKVQFSPCQAAYNLVST